jgi:type IV pilus assembly protein PilE
MRSEGDAVPRTLAREHGFTLLELLIVIVLIALLASVALPSYQGSIAKARRADARAALTKCAQMLERWYTENATGGYSGATIPGVCGPIASEYSHYNLTLPAADLRANTFTLNATPVGAQANDGCGTFTLNQAGERGVTGGTKPAAECW